MIVLKSNSMIVKLLFESMTCASFVEVVRNVTVEWLLINTIKVSQSSLVRISLPDHCNNNRLLSISFLVHPLHELTK